MFNKTHTALVLLIFMLAAYPSSLANKSTGIFITILLVSTFAILKPPFYNSTLCTQYIHGVAISQTFFLVTNHTTSPDPTLRSSGDFFKALKKQHRASQLSKLPVLELHEQGNLERSCHIIATGKRRAQVCVLGPPSPSTHTYTHAVIVSDTAERGDFH